MKAWRAVSFVCLLGAATGAMAQGPKSAPLWWERGADKWCYRDDWKGQALSGSQAYTKTLSVPGGAASGWIVLWGSGGYKLSVNGRAVGANVDGGLVDDYDLKRCIAPGAREVTLRIEGDTVVAEGEIIARTGKRYPFATGTGWRSDRGGTPAARPMVVGPTSGAYDRARNGRLLTYNGEERGKTAIARALARIQRLNEQGIYLMRRLRPADQVVSFDPHAPWREAEAGAAWRTVKARSILATQAIPAQKAGKYARAVAVTRQAAAILDLAEASVTRVSGAYRARRAALDRANRVKLGASKTAQGGALDAFPEDRFAWLNARDLMGSDPAHWPFSLVPASSGCIDLAGRWDFRTDPDNVGEREGWQNGRGAGWRKLYAPGPWERQGVTQDNPKSPADAPYRLGDARTGDKPYNGYAWYAKPVVIPAAWRGKTVKLSVGAVSNWARVFLNGTPLDAGGQSWPAVLTLPSERIRFGESNMLALQVYNHDNFGGITAGPVALYTEGAAPASVETPGPLSYTQEVAYPTPAGRARMTYLASALSPAVVVASDRPRLEMRGWEARGYAPPSSFRYAARGGLRTERPAMPAGFTLGGAALTENWLLLRSEDADTLLMLERRPAFVAWRRNAEGQHILTIASPSGAARVWVLVLPEGTRLDDAGCRFWVRALRRYPVSASEVVARNGLAQTCRVRYNYLELGGFGALKPLSIAPAPMLASYGLAYRYPGLRVDGVRATGYRSQYAPYLAAVNTDTLTYRAPAVDRSKVMKGIGELFGKPKAEYNARGGVSEDEMFRRMGAWGFDHCRYAFAFHADWDLPLVRYMGGPLLPDNDANWRRLDELVRKCNGAGMQMMLTWFFNEDSPQRDAGGAVRNSTRYWLARPETQKNAFELWRRIAARYASLPQDAISYDFFNEPAYMNPDHWNEVIRDLTAVIRSVDRKHMIVWEAADGWAQPFWCLWMQPAKDANALYSFHHYGKHWGYSYDEYYPSYKSTTERTQIDPWLEAILFSIQHNVPIHCGEFGISMIQPDGDGARWLEDYLAFFERFGIGWNWWNYSGGDIYRTGLAAGNRISPYVPILSKWAARSGWGASHRSSIKASAR